MQRPASPEITAAQRTSSEATSALIALRDFIARVNLAVPGTAGEKVTLETMVRLKSYVEPGHTLRLEQLHASPVLMAKQAVVELLLYPNATVLLGVTACRTAPECVPQGRVVLSVRRQPQIVPYAVNSSIAVVGAHVSTVLMER